MGLLAEGGPVTFIACYDLSKCPPTYDIVSFLLQAELRRLELGEPHMEVHILPGPVFGFRVDNLWPRSPRSRRSILRNIVLPICSLLPSARGATTHFKSPENLRGAFGYGEYRIGLVPFYEAYAREIRPLRAPPVEKIPNLITITLREAEHWPERNSRNEEWLSAARSLRAIGFRVVVIRDTRLADEPFEDFETAPEASRSIAKRAEIYTAALCNLMISNGPTQFALALNAPVLFIRPTIEGLWKMFGAEGYARAGIEEGAQFPGAPHHQRVVWAEDFANEILLSTMRFISDLNN